MRNISFSLWTAPLLNLGQQGKRVAYGAAAEFCGSFAFCSLGTATFGYLALHVKG